MGAQSGEGFGACVTGPPIVAQSSLACSVQIINVYSLISFGERCADIPSGACKQHRRCNGKTGQTGRTTTAAAAAAAAAPSASPILSEQIRLLWENDKLESTQNS